MLSALATTAVASASPATETAGAILAANHAAVGDMPSSGAAELTYDYSGYGLTGSRTDSLDLHTGAFVQATQVLPETRSRAAACGADAAEAPLAACVVREGPLEALRVEIRPQAFDET